MPDVKAYSTADATALTALAESDDLMNLLPPDTYNLTLDATATVTVPTLTAGSIDQASPSIGDTLTVTGSNAPSGATYQWEESADGSTGWADLTGKTSATLDTSTGVTDNYYVRRGVQISGVQSEVFTAAVQVAAAAGWTENVVTVPEGTYFTTDDWPTTHKSSLWLYSGTYAGAADILSSIFSWDGRARYWQLDNNSSPGNYGARFRIGDSTPVNTAVVNQPIPDNTRGDMIIAAWTDNDPTTPLLHIVGYWRSALGAWNVLANITQASSVSANLEFTPGPMTLLARSDGVTDDNYAGTIHGLGAWTSPTAAANGIIDITVAANRDEFFDGSGLKDPTDFHAAVLAADANAVMQVGLFGPATDWNAEVHSGIRTLSKFGTDFT